MKNLARPSFFRMFDLLLSKTNGGLKQPRWTYDSVEFVHERHSFAGPRYSVTVSVFTLTRGGRRAWGLMITKEVWWVGEDSKPFKDLRWARHVSGQRNDMMSWLREQEQALERSFSMARSAREHHERESEFEVVKTADDTKRH